MLRYPGGKLRLMKKINIVINQELVDLKDNKEILIGDCFVGGGGSLINLAKDFPNAKFSINDKNIEVFKFWRFFINATNKDIEDFISKIKNVKPTLEKYHEIFNSQPNDDFDFAFKILFLNKTSFNGYITKPIPIGGKEQKGKWKLDCYWNHKTLSKNINNTYSLLKNRVISVTNDDYKDFLEKKYDMIYADPPYIKYGSKWYGIDFNIENFEELLILLKKASDKVVVSIDNQDAVLDIARKYDYLIKQINIKYTSKSSFKKNIDSDNELILIKNVERL
ncbi:MAG: hypothetical protein ACOC33_00355 [bacterium]